MRSSRPLCLALALAQLAPTAAAAGDIAASAPTDLSVTIYRDPSRSEGPINLSYSGGFALVTETRRVHLPAGESRLRFEGVIDGIQSATAIVTGLQDGVIEKNRDAALLSPQSLLRASNDGDVTLVRTDRRTGKVFRERAMIVSANAEGVTFRDAEGVQAFKCSGVAETFRFDAVPVGLSAKPTLSVLTRSSRAVDATVTLSYLARGFDWAVNYVANIGPTGQTLDLTGWATLANNNAVGLPSARTQIVAGRLNQYGFDGELADPLPVLAKCWPSGTTSDTPAERGVTLAKPYGFDSETRVGTLVVTAYRRGAPAPMMAAPAPPPPPPPPPPPEQLADLKLYRVPGRTTVSAMQSKQVVLLRASGVPIMRYCEADLDAGGVMGWSSATVVLRTRNDVADQLGLPLPSGQVALFSRVADRDMLLSRGGLHDTAVDEDVELRLGAASDVRLRQTATKEVAFDARAPNRSARSTASRPRGAVAEEVEIRNARDTDTLFELRLAIGAGQIVEADQPIATKGGRPIFRLTIPAGGSVKVHYRFVSS